jgi:hypothetical protein
LDGGATRLGGLEMKVDGVIWGGVDKVKTVVGQSYEERKGAY